MHALRSASHKFSYVGLWQKSCLLFLFLFFDADAPLGYIGDDDVISARVRELCLHFIFISVCVHCPVGTANRSTTGRFLASKRLMLWFKQKYNRIITVLMDSRLDVPAACQRGFISDTHLHKHTPFAAKTFNTQQRFRFIFPLNWRWWPGHRRAENWQCLTSAFSTIFCFFTFLCCVWCEYEYVLTTALYASQCIEHLNACAYAKLIFFIINRCVGVSAVVALNPFFSTSFSIAYSAYLCSCSIR